MFRVTLLGSVAENGWINGYLSSYDVQESDRTRSELPSLHDAATRGDAEQIRNILKRDTRFINERNKNGMTPLHVSYYLTLLQYGWSMRLLTRTDIIRTELFHSFLCCV